MEKKKKKIWLIGGLVLCLVTVIGITFAFFSTGGTQDTANTFTSGCLNIELTDASSSINLTNTYPISDVEGVDNTSYDFTIRNTCDTPTNYSINLESLNQVANTLNANYIKVSLSSNTVDNVISKLSDNTSITPELDGAYEAYTLYTGNLGANETKTYHLKLWIDYDATVEQAANKTYSSKINVIANPETEVVDTLEATFTLDNKTLTSSLSNNVTSATYCTTTTNICEPTTPATITNNSYTVELEENENNQIVCTKLNGTSKIICSNGLEVKPLCPEGATACNTIIAASKPQGQTTDWTNNGQGTTYYYTGDVPSEELNNWVQFAGFWWRIIRINGDGSIRMIYQGTSANETGSGTQIGTSAFNSSYNNKTYVGLVYDGTNQHGSGTPSTIMNTLNTWYNNLASYETDYIDTGTGFCSDRNMASGYNWSSSTVYYAPYDRRDGTGTLQCNSEDILSKDNGKLQNPIGLVTADEAALTGIIWNNANTGSYLYTGEYYWTMSPYRFNDGFGAYVFFVYSSGYLGADGLVYWGMHSALGVRPVINIRADVSITGSGTVFDPFKVVGAN